MEEGNYYALEGYTFSGLRELPGYVLANIVLRRFHIVWGIPFFARRDNRVSSSSASEQGF